MDDGFGGDLWAKGSRRGGPRRLISCQGQQQLIFQASRGNSDLIFPGSAFYPGILLRFSSDVEFNLFFRFGFRFGHLVFRTPDSFLFGIGSINGFSRISRLGFSWMSGSWVLRNSDDRSFSGLDVGFQDWMLFFRIGSLVFG